MKGLMGLLGMDDVDFQASLGRFQTLFDDVKKCLENQKKIMQHLGIDEEESEDGDHH